MTIGRPNGNAWIGKPLDLVIPLELDTSESGDSLCLEADVQQGDARVDDKRVTLSLDPGPSPDAPRVRLRTTRAVEEPVVTVKFTAGCVTKSTRQYVLLADLPESQPVVASPPRLSAPAVSAVDGASAAAPAPRSSRPSRAAAGPAVARAAPEGGEGASVQPPAPPPRKRVAAVVPPPAGSAEAPPKPRPKPAKPVTAAPAPVAEPKSRLSVEALAPESSAQAPRPALTPANPAASATTATVPAGQAAAAPGAPASAPVAEAPNAAAAAASAALAAANEQSRRDAERLKELEAALATLREQSAQTQRQLLELRGSLAQAEASRYGNPVVFGLLALLALALIGLVLLWRSARRARQAVWWGAGPVEEAAAATAAAKPSLPRHGELAIDDDDDDDDDEEEVQAAPADVSGLRKAAQGLRVTALPAGMGASAFHQAQVRQVSAEEVFDVQQQSDFFMSLGQHEQAVGVLREHIAAYPGTSALPYLDLLEVLQSLGRREDYAAVAREFSQNFNVEAPSFGYFSVDGPGLEHYRNALQRITDKWPSQGTADVIEELVFRKPGTDEESFDLQAYQDLLMLYAVARDLSEYEGPWAAPTPVPVQAPAPVPGPGPVLPESSEQGGQEVSPVPYLPESRQPERPFELDLADLDRTAFETLRAPIEPNPAAVKPAPAPSGDPHVIDFDPFDPATNQGDLRPRHLGVKR